VDVVEGDEGINLMGRKDGWRRIHFKMVSDGVSIALMLKVEVAVPQMKEALEARWRVPKETLTLQTEEKMDLDDATCAEDLDDDAVVFVVQS
jgi:hypothetical protein